MSGESQKCLHVLADVGRDLNLHVRTLCEECDIGGDWVSATFRHVAHAINKKMQRVDLPLRRRAALLVHTGLGTTFSGRRTAAL